MFIEAITVNASEFLGNIQIPQRAYWSLKRGRMIHVLCNCRDRVYWTRCCLQLKLSVWTLNMYHADLGDDSWTWRHKTFHPIELKKDKQLPTRLCRRNHHRQETSVWNGCISPELLLRWAGDATMLLPVCPLYKFQNGDLNVALYHPTSACHAVYLAYNGSFHFVFFCCGSCIYILCSWHCQACSLKSPVCFSDL